jgi:flagellin
MALVVNTNLASLNVLRHLATSDALLRRSFERIASGLRINNAFDDPAGLAIADRLGADVRIATQAIRNANDGLSALAIGEKALGQETAILERLAELASESASGLVSDSQRSALQAEFAALLAEIDRIAGTTTFNDVSLLSPGTTVAVQVGLDGSASSRIEFATVDGSATGLGIASTSVATQAGAQAALPLIADAIETVALRRGTFGAVESRLLSAIENLRVAVENFTAAESRIRDADVAAETANLTRASILQQAGVAILAQANQQPAIALLLLR